MSRFKRRVTLGLWPFIIFFSVCFRFCFLSFMLFSCPHFIMPHKIELKKQLFSKCFSIKAL